MLQGVLHEFLVFAAVRLSTKGMNCGAFTAVEHPELNAGPVCRLAHFAAQGINLPDQMAFAGAADGGVAGHVAHGIQIDGKDNGFQSQACGGQGGFDACMARTDDRNVVGLHLIFCHMVHLCKVFFGCTTESVVHFVLLYHVSMVFATVFLHIFLSCKGVSACFYFDTMIK